MRLCIGLYCSLQWLMSVSLKVDGWAEKLDATLIVSGIIINHCKGATQHHYDPKYKYRLYINI